MVMHSPVTMETAADCYGAIIWPSSRSRTQTVTQRWPPPSTGESLLEVPKKPGRPRSRNTIGTTRTGRNHSGLGYLSRASVHARQLHAVR
jgi:hypothetical protein